MKWLKKIATKKIILLALGATGAGAALNPATHELIVSIALALVA